MAAGRNKGAERGLSEQKFNKRPRLWSGTRNPSTLDGGGHWRLEDGAALLTALLSGQQSGMGFNDPPPGNQSTFRSTNFIVSSKYPNGMGLLQETKRRLREVSFLKSECQSLNVSLETLPTAIQVCDSAQKV